MAYDEWFPVFFVREDGSLGGLMYDVYHIVAARLGLREEFVRNRDPGVWGSSNPNGTFRGLLGMIQRGEADLTVSGVGITAERAEFFDFSADVISMRYSLFTKRPTGARVSLQNYFWEFDRYIWTCTAATSFLLIIGLALALHSCALPKSLSKAMSVVLNALLYKSVRQHRLAEDYDPHHVCPQHCAHCQL